LDFYKANLTYIEKAYPISPSKGKVGEKYDRRTKPKMEMCRSMFY
jgi:hypothetical protein